MPAKKKDAATTSKQDDGKLCFVITPFGGRNDLYRDEVYYPAVREAGLEPRRADDLYRPGSIVEDIWSLVRNSRVMLADLTGKNPNVLYELGLAHAVGKPVVLLARDMEDVPFDLRSLRVLTYDTDDPNWGPLLKRDITSALKEVLAAPAKAVPPTFLKESKVQAQPSVSAIEKTLAEMRSEIDLLKAARRTGLKKRGPLGSSLKKGGSKYDLLEGDADLNEATYCPECDEIGMVMYPDGSGRRCSNCGHVMRA